MRTLCVWVYSVVGLTGVYACGDALTDTTYRGGAAAVLTPQTATGGAVTSPVSGGDPQSSSCVTDTFAPQTITGNYDPNVVAHSLLQAAGQDGNTFIAVDNYASVAGGVQPGHTEIISLDPNNSLPACGFCVTATGPSGETLGVESGTATFTAPLDGTASAKVTFDHLILRRRVGNVSARWCVPAVTLEAASAPWSCAELGVQAQAGGACFVDDKAKASDVISCDANGIALTTDNCASRNLDCSVSAAAGGSLAQCGRHFR